jgi:hypothetical protein
MKASARRSSSSAGVLARLDEEQRHRLPFVLEGHGLHDVAQLLARAHLGEERVGDDGRDVCRGGARSGCRRPARIRAAAPSC